MPMTDSVLVYQFSGALADDTDEPGVDGAPVLVRCPVATSTVERDQSGGGYCVLWDGRVYFCDDAPEIVRLYAEEGNCASCSHMGEDGHSHDVQEN